MKESVKKDVIVLIERNEKWANNVNQIWSQDHGVWNNGLVWIEY